MTAHRTPHTIVQKAGSSGNSDAPWDEFDPTAYFKHNYQILRPDDRAIICFVRDHFLSTAPSGPLHGVDVGSGSNLYPALSMVPWCSDITLVERSSQNVAWLQNEVTNGYSAEWDQFWDVLTTREPYRRVPDPRARLSAQARVQRGSVFSLPSETWDIGTMFFVACSISNLAGEFNEATDRFLASLRPGAPFAMAFMENSDGYDVNGQGFPAVRVESTDVRRALESRSSKLVIERIPSESLRSGYTGMLVALGRKRSG
jgi:hypothetical protein